MLHSLVRRFGVLAYAAVLIAGLISVTWEPAPLLAQETKCYIVACTGNVCVWQQITCPPPKPT